MLITYYSTPLVVLWPVVWVLWFIVGFRSVLEGLSQLVKYIYKQAYRDLWFYGKSILQTEDDARSL